MLTRERLILFITLTCITLFIFSSSTILGKHFTFESQVEAKTTRENSHSLHQAKVTNVHFKDTSLNDQFRKSDSLSPLYLTFDDGPTEFTVPILDILEDYQIDATFFMLNGNILDRPETVKSIADRGHTLGCHGVSHKVTTFYQTATSPLKEMTTCGNSVEMVTGENVAIVRVPFGSFPHLTSIQKKELDQSSFIMWDWNVDSKDWSIHNADQMVRIVLAQVTKLKEKEVTPVLLFHDKEITVNALPKIIKALKELGYEFKPITTQDEPVQFRQKK